MDESQENSIVYADPSKCIGCKKCERSCYESHSPYTWKEAKKMGLNLISRIHIIRIDDAKVPILCRQCEDAPCAHACPTGALYQEGGLVHVNEARCVGCKVCVMACPFGIIEVLPESPSEAARTNRGVVRKCDLCEQRRKEDGNFDCACVNNCPTGALTLIKVAEYRKQLMLARAKEMVHPTALASTPK